MRDTPLSNCERDFLLKAIQEKKRLDGRQTYDYRSIKISFGTDYGCCFVDLGKTRRVFLPFEGKEMTVEQWLSTKATGLSKADR